MKVMIVVTHLLGTGHLSRAMVLARALRQAGDEVLLVSGGMPVPHLSDPDLPLVQLLPLRSDGTDFSRLLTGSDDPATAEDLAARSRLLIETLWRFGPDVLVTELFPFGRRNLRAEFLALLEEARKAQHPPLVCASIRDILAPPTRAKKALFAQGTLAEHYNAVLVHSDPAFTPLSLSWPVTEIIAAKLHYTGFVAPPPAQATGQTPGKGEILVTAGGGAVGQPLFDAARAAAALRPDWQWRLLIGGAEAGALAERIAASAPDNLLAEPARPDFRAMLTHAAASLSLCGYNTALDVLQAGTPAVFVPFDAGSEVEQTIRAEALTAQEGIAALRTADLSPQRLISALETVQRDPRRTARPDAFNGATRTATILAELVKGRP